MLWRRARLVVTSDTRGVFLGSVLPEITLRPSAATGRLRIGLWVAGERLLGYQIPPLPANAVVVIREGRSVGLTEVQVFDWGGVFWPKRGQLMPHGTFTLTLDQEDGLAVPVLVDVSVEAVEARA